MIFLLQERNVWRKIVWYTAATEGHWKCLSLGFLWYGKWYQSICTACDFYHENTSLFQEPCFGNFFCTTDQQPSRFWWYFPSQTDFYPFYEIQDWHPDSGESCDQEHHQLCGKLHTYLHFAHTSDIVNKKRAIYDNTVWASNVFQAKKTLYTLSHNQAKETLYWGEYPLYFAACLGQEESYRLILARFLSSLTKLMAVSMMITS